MNSSRTTTRTSATAIPSRLGAVVCPVQWRRSTDSYCPVLRHEVRAAVITAPDGMKTSQIHLAAAESIKAAAKFNPIRINRADR